MGSRYIKYWKMIRNVSDNKPDMEELFAFVERISSIRVELLLLNLVGLVMSGNTECVYKLFRKLSEPRSIPHFNKSIL